MQESVVRTEGTEKPVVWREVDPNDCIYVARCSFCGAFKRKLLKHWFYTGIYCFGCVQDVLYHNVRTVKEINDDS